MIAEIIYATALTLINFYSVHSLTLTLEQSYIITLLTAIMRRIWPMDRKCFTQHKFWCLCQSLTIVWNHNYSWCDNHTPITLLYSRSTSTYQIWNSSVGKEIVILSEKICFAPRASFLNQAGIVECFKGYLNLGGCQSQTCFLSKLAKIASMTATSRTNTYEK